MCLTLLVLCLGVDLTLLVICSGGDVSDIASFMFGCRCV